MEKKMKTTTVLWGYILGLYWVCIGIMEKMETTGQGLGFRIKGWE